MRSLSCGVPVLPGASVPVRAGGFGAALSRSWGSCAELLSPPSERGRRECAFRHVALIGAVPLRPPRPIDADDRSCHRTRTRCSLNGSVQLHSLKMAPEERVPLSPAEGALSLRWSGSWPLAPSSGGESRHVFGMPPARFAAGRMCNTFEHVSEPGAVCT
uniref:Uncharacterized protein n=1 Tax=Knipowitschia caucasica TaxID=637954 RepID=A0AAV2MFF6_KNICA